MFIEAVIGSIVGSALTCSNVPGKIYESTNKISTQLSYIRDILDGMNTTLTDTKSKISDIEIEQSRMFHEFQWHDLVQTLMAKNAVYRGNNILELKENDSVIQLNLVERSITETKFGKTYKKTFDGCEYIDGKSIHSKDTNGEKWFNLEGKCIHEVDSNGRETWYEYDTSSRCIHKKVEYGNDYAEYWWEFDAEGKRIRFRSKQNLFCGSSDNERLVEYGNVIHIVSKINGVLLVDCYCYKDFVKTDYYLKFLYSVDELYIVRKFIPSEYIYAKSMYMEMETGDGITHFFTDDTWKDANGIIKRGVFNFLTHTYDKRIALAKHKLEEAKSIIKTSI